MTERAKYKQAMRCLIEATHSVSALVGVPVETLILAMLAAVKREDANTLLIGGRCRDQALAWLDVGRRHPQR